MYIAEFFIGIVDKEISHGDPGEEDIGDKGTHLEDIAIVLSLPLLISLKSSASNLAGMGMTNLQIVVKRVFTWIGLFGILMLFLQVELNVSNSNMLIVAMSYFITEHLLGLRKKWIAELTFSGLLILVWAVLYFSPFY